jgi:hypothetical protein
MKTLGTYTPEGLDGYFDHETGTFLPHDWDEEFLCAPEDFSPYSGPTFSAFDDADNEW